MQNQHIETLSKLRISVLSRGEELPANYWDSQGLNSTAQADLEFIFPRTGYLAAVTHAKELAREHHDATTRGAGVYHLFRLPVEVESAIHSYLVKNASSIGKHEPFSELQDLPGSEATSFEGAVDLGAIDLKSPAKLSSLAHTYKKAMDEKKSTSPFFTLAE